MALTKVTTDMLADGVINSGQNVIINGDMEIPQRGTSFVSPASDAYTLDRMQWGIIGAATHTITQDTDVPTVAQAGRLFTHSMKIALTAADTSIAAADNCYFRQHIEGYNWRALAQRAFTLSFWVKAPITGTFCVGFRNGGGDRSYVAEYTINATNTWEKKTITVPASPAAGTWLYTNGIGLTVYFTLAAGSNYQTAANAWQTGSFFATSNQVNGVNTGVTPFFFTGIELVAGSANNGAVQRHYGQELNLCYRYFVRFDSTNLAGGRAAGQCFGATSGALNVTLPVMMRTTPTGTFTVGSGTVWTAGGGNQAITSFLNPAYSAGAVQTQFTTAAGLAAGNAAVMTGVTGVVWDITAEL